MGFYPLTPAQLSVQYDKFCLEPGSSSADRRLAALVTSHSLQHLLQVNDYLVKYVEQWYPLFTVFVQVCLLLPTLE